MVSMTRMFDYCLGRGSGRGEYRRSYGNSARGSRGGYNRASADSYTPDFDNTNDFPTLPK